MEHRSKEELEVFLRNPSTTLLKIKSWANLNNIFITPNITKKCELVEYCLEKINKLVGDESPPSSSPLPSPPSSSPSPPRLIKTTKITKTTRSKKHTIDEDDRDNEEYRDSNRPISIKKSKKNNKKSNGNGIKISEEGEEEEKVDEAQQQLAIESENKCLYHTEFNIECICNECQVPACRECLYSDDHHRGHKIDRINFETTSKLFNDFKDKQLPYLIKDLSETTTIESQSDNLLEIITQKYNECIDKVEGECKKLQQLLESEKNQLLRQLETEYTENVTLHKSIKEQVENGSIGINLILEKYKDKDINQVFNTRQSIEILRDIHQSKSLVSSNQPNFKTEILLSDYTVPLVNDINSKRFSQSIKKELYVSSNLLLYKEPSKITVDLLLGERTMISFFNYRDRCTIPSNFVNIAFGPNVKQLKIGTIPSYIDGVFLLDGFDQILIPGMIPPTVKCLLIGALKRPLIYDSIPDHVETVILMDGFNMTIKENDGIIPGNIQILCLCDTKYKVGYPKAIENVYASEVYKKKFNCFDEVPSFSQNFSCVSKLEWN